MNSNKPTRREILKASCFTMTGMAVPYAITSPALGNKDNLPASERVALAHIGVGSRGGYLLKHYSAERCGAQSVAVADCYC